MAGAAVSGSGLSKFLPPKKRPQATDIQAAVMWGVAATTIAIWLIQFYHLLVSPWPELRRRREWWRN